MTLWEVNSFKNMYAATPSKKIEVTFAFFDYALKYSKVYQDGTTSSGTPYHTEAYFHAGLLDAEFGGYIMQSEVGSVPEYQYRLEFVAAVMDELTRLVGYADRKPIEVPVNWNDSFILSGMYANGRNVWRITPDTISGVSKKNFLVKNSGGEVVFSNKGQTITFPQGTIIKDGFIPAVGSCGYWVETPADVMPLISSDKDRYSQHPAFGENFDAYQSRSSFDPATTRYSHTWEVLKLEGSSITIKESQENANDKVLALQGNAYLNNITVPKLLTAGDHYAQQQNWEVTFSLSALPDSNAEVKLLTGTSGSATDRGFRIYNGKLYYGQENNYQPFDGVSLAAGVEYTLKRTIDFRSFTGSYYVYDANGNLLDKAENVSLQRLSLPVEKVGFSTEKFGDNTLFLDSYKLYAAGVTTDFELYDAQTGIQIKQLNTMQESNTAYRLSWINASDEAKCYNVVAAYSGGSKQVVNTITMLPGCDGVTTGIVKVGNSAVMLSLEETEVKVPDNDEGGRPIVDNNNQGGDNSDLDEDYNDYNDDYNNDYNNNFDNQGNNDSNTATEGTDASTGAQGNNNDGSSSILLLVIIILIVLAACGLAAVLVIRNMPKKSTAPEPPVNAAAPEAPVKTKAPEPSPEDDIDQLIASIDALVADESHTPDDTENSEANAE